MNWLPKDFTHPERVELASGHRLCPIHAADVVIDYPAVMGARERRSAKYGEAWGWPPGEAELLGCVYIDPADERSPAGSHAVVSWWLVDRT